MVRNESGTAAATQVAAEAARRRREARWHEQATALGYPDMPALLDATRSLTNVGLGEMLGVSVAVVVKLRKYHEIPSPNFAATNRRPRRPDRRRDPFRTDPDARPVVPQGVQPEADGKIQCLDCGRWYQLLGNHLRRAHGITVDEYQEEFGLPASRGLVPEPLRETMSSNALRRLETEPGLREALARGAEALAERRAETAEARYRTRDRAAVLANLRASARASSDKRSSDIHARRDVQAFALGYRDFTDLLQQTTDLTGEQLGEILGESAGQVGKLRRRYGIKSRAREVAKTRRRAERAERSRPPEVPHGTQPRDGERLHCLDCGDWFDNLAGHIGPKHHVSIDGYRDRHGLTMGPELPGLPISRAAVVAARADRAPEIQEQRRRQLATGTRQRSRQIEERYDAAAKVAGYEDLDALLRSTATMRECDVAPILRVTGSTVGRLRRARGITAQYPRKVYGPLRKPTTGGSRRQPSRDYPADPPQLPMGVQPEDEEGKLQCRECGRWFVGLAYHVWHAHEMTADDYRAAYELKLNHSLIGSDLRERFANRERARIEANPQWWAKVTATTPEEQAERLAMGHARRTEVKDRAEYRAIGRELTRHAGQVRSDRIRPDDDALAREHGYPDAATMLAATVDLTSRRLGERLGLTPEKTVLLRHRYGVRSQGRWVEYAERKARRRAETGDEA